MSLTFEAFRSSSFVKQFTTVDVDEDSEPSLYQSAVVLHSVYCNDRTCEWDAEEEYLADEWVGSEHQTWLRVASRISDLEISLSDAIKSCEEVYSRTGIIN